MEELKITPEKEAKYTGICIQAQTKELQKKLLEKTMIRNWLMAITEHASIVEPVSLSYFDANILTVNMPCGETVQYKTMFDIPTETTMCPCGNPNHKILEFIISEKV